MKLKTFEKNYKICLILFTNFPLKIPTLLAEKNSSKIQVRNGVKSINSFSKSEKQNLLDFAWRVSKIGRQS